MLTEGEKADAVLSALVGCPQSGRETLVRLFGMNTELERCDYCLRWIFTSRKEATRRLSSSGHGKRLDTFGSSA